MKAIAKYPGSKWSLADWIISFFSRASQLFGTVFRNRGSAVQQTKVTH